MMLRPGSCACAWFGECREYCGERELRSGKSVEREYCEERASRREIVERDCGGRWWREMVERDCGERV
jgi:hypothetical protein